MKKRTIVLLAVLALGATGSVFLQKLQDDERARRAALSPDERAAEDETRRAERQATADSAQRAREQTPGYAKGLAEAALKDRMKDPDAAQFRNEVVYRRGDTLVVCGEVNAKNGYGGYVGFRRFVAMRGVAITEEDLNGKTATTATAFFEKCADAP